jgi:hypothetical protein
VLPHRPSLVVLLLSPVNLERVPCALFFLCLPAVRLFVDLSYTGLMDLAGSCRCLSSC